MKKKRVIITFYDTKTEAGRKIYAVTDKSERELQEIVNTELAKDKLLSITYIVEHLEHLGYLEQFEPHYEHYYIDI